MAATTSPEPERIDRRRRRSRRDLLRACEELILERGYRKTTANAVAERADLGRRTFYNHFENKRGCVLAALTDRYEGYAAEVFTPRNDGEDRALSIVRTATTVLERILSDPLTGKLLDTPRLLAQAVDSSQRQFLREDIEVGVGQGRFALEIGFESFSAILLWGFVGLILQTSQSGRRTEARADWGRFLLLNLGVPARQIEGIVEQALLSERCSAPRAPGGTTP